jgi:hypothetical protein
MPPKADAAKVSRKKVPLRQKMMPPLMPQGTLMPHLIPPKKPIAMRIMATVATVATEMGTLGNPTP